MPGKKDYLAGFKVAIICLVFLYLWSTGAWAISNFLDIDTQPISSGLGTIEFRVKLLKDISTDAHNHVLLLAVSSDGAEFYKVEIVEDALIVWRQFGGCLRAAFSAKYGFKTGEWHNLKLTWNRESTELYIDSRKINKLGLYSSQDLGKMLPCIRLGRDDSFEISDFSASAVSNVSVAAEDAQFVNNCQCPNLAQLIAEPPQEEYRGMALQHFPDQKSRDKIKSYIVLLPEDFARAIKHVVFVEDSRFPKGGEAGLAQFDTMSLVLKGSYFDDPKVFFHEAAHLYDDKLGVNFGVPEEKSEWTAISGQTCYYKGAKMEEFAREFEETKQKNGFLAGQGGQCPSEDLAIWAGAAYDYYLKNKSFSEMLDTSSPQYSDKTRKKLDFLLRKGFINGKIYDKITSEKNKE